MGSLKRSLALVLTVVMMLSLLLVNPCVATVAAEDNTNIVLQFVPDKTTVQAGDVVRLAVNVSGLSSNGWEALSGSVSYDPDELKPVAYEAGPASPSSIKIDGFTLPSIIVNLDVNPVIYSSVSVDAMTANGDILFLDFEVQDSVAPGTEITLTVTVDSFGYTLKENGMYIGRVDLVPPNSVCDVNLSVGERTLKTVEMDTPPATTVYHQGDTELDLADAKLRLTYDNGATKTVDITEDMVSGFDTATTGTKTIAVTYEGKTTSFTITVVEKKLIAVAVDTPPTKTVYYQGDAGLDLTGAKLNLVYNSGIIKTVNITEDMVSGFDTATTGVKTIVVDYEGKVTSFDITVEEKKLMAVVVDTPPVKTVYKQGDVKLDLAGAKLSLVYNNGTTEIMDITEDMVSGFDTATAGSKNIVVIYEDQTTSFTIMVEERSLVAIAVDTYPAKMVYKQGDAELDLTGAKLTLAYGNGDTQTVDITADMVSGFDTTIVGVKNIMVAYQGKTTSFTITVEESTSEYGNVDGSRDENGVPTVTAADALLALQAATGKVVLTAEEQAVANVDADEEAAVTANDALLILQYATRKITLFPVEQ